MKNKNILFIINTRIPSEKAHSRQIFEMANSLSKLSNCSIYALNRKQDNPDLKNVSYENFYKISKLKITQTTTFDDTLLKKFSLLRKLLIVFNALSIIIKCYFNRKNIDFIYTRETLISYFLILLNFKVILEIHQIGTYQLSQKFFSFYLNSLVKLKKKNFLILALSKNLKNKILAIKNNKFIADITHVLHDAYRPLFMQSYLQKENFFNIKENYDCAYIGQLFSEKGIMTIIEIAEQNPKLNFLIIGGLKKDVQYWTSVCKQKAVNNVNFTGFIEPVHIEKYIKKIKIFIIPQLNDDAESPLKLFEYLHFNRPILASGTNPIKEILKHGFNSMIFTPGDSKSASEMLNQILKNPNLYKKISHNSFMLSKDFTWDKRAKKLIDLSDLI